MSVRVVSESCFRLCIRTLALRCTMKVSLQFGRGPICISNSTSEMSMLESGSIGKLPVTWSRRVFKR